jgi:hypothetical protein
MLETKSPFHPGEKEIQSRIGIQEKIEQLGRRMIRHRIPEKHLGFFAGLLLLMIGTVDAPLTFMLSTRPGAPTCRMRWGTNIAERIRHAVPAYLNCSLGISEKGRSSVHRGQHAATLTSTG